MALNPITSVMMFARARRSGGSLFWFGGRGIGFWRSISRRGTIGACRSASAFDRQDLEGVLNGFAKPGDFFLLGLQESVELRDFLRVLALFVFAEREQMGVSFRTPVMEEEFVFFQDGLAQFFGLVHR